MVIVVFYLLGIDYEGIECHLMGQWNGQKPLPLSEIDLLQQLESILTEYKKEDVQMRWMEENGKLSARKRKLDQSRETIWKKKSIFFELPYWAGNLIRHNLGSLQMSE